MLRPGDEPIRGYRLEAFLGQGQFGQVWKTTSPGGGSAALKFLDLMGKEGLKELRGIQRVKAIRHAHLMPITALWLLDEDGTVLHDDALLQLSPERSPEATLVPADLVQPTNRPRWLVVAQVLAEKTLRDQLSYYQEQAQSGIPVAELLTYMEEAAKGIDYLNSDRHDLGDGLFAVQHCDIKPANMLLVGGSVMVCDFGLAHIMVQDHASRTTGIPGSPAFVAPECIDQRPSATSDQYSLAISYFELRTGQLPFKDQTPLGAMDAHRSGNLDFSGLPTAEAEVVARATSLNPEKRYANCLDFVRDLQRAAGVNVPPPITQSSGYAWMLPGLVTVVLLGALLCLLFFPNARPPAEHAFAIALVPSDAKLTIDGEEIPVVDGRVEIARAPTALLNVMVSKGLNFDVHSQRVAVSDFSLQQPLRVTLQPSAYALALAAEQQWAEGNANQAIQQLGKAIRKDARFAVFPDAIVVSAPDQGRLGAVSQFAITADGAWVVAGDKRGMVGRWAVDKVRDGPHAAVPQHQHQGMVESLVTAGSWVASADNQGTVLISQVDSTATSAETLSLQTRGLIRLALSSRADFLICGSDYQLQRWQRSSAGSFESRPLGAHRDAIADIKIVEADTVVITASWDGEVRRWQADAAESQVTLGSFDGEVFALAVSDRAVAYGGHQEGGQNHVFVVPLAGGQPSALPELLQSPIATLQFDPSGTLLAAGTEDDGRVSVWREITPDRWQRIPTANLHDDSITSLAFTDSQWLVSASNDGSLVLWDLSSSPSRTAVIAAGFPPISGMRLTPDARWVLVLLADGQLQALDLNRCRFIQQASEAVGIKARPPSEAAIGVEA